MTEKETIILINADDLKRGYFQIGTSNEAVHKKVLKRVGKENVLQVRLSKDRSGKITWYQMRIKKIALSKSYSTRLVNPNRFKASKSAIGASSDTKD